MPDLSGNESSVVLAPGYELRARGLAGRAHEIRSDEIAARSDGGLHDAGLQKAIDGAGLAAEFAFEWEVTDDSRPDGETGLMTREGESAVEFAAPALGANVGYAVLYTDEAGISRWIFPENTGGVGGNGFRGGGAEVVFHLPRQAPPRPPVAAESEPSRGTIAKLGRRLVRLLTWATDGVVGAGARFAAEKWENARRPYGFLRVTPEAIGGEVNWTQLGQGRALLLLHGTFSTAQSAFADWLTSPAFAEIYAHYGQRVFAFNHPSLHHSPAENVTTMLATLPGGSPLDFDLVAHSRGGLVGRDLVERSLEQASPGQALRVGRVVFVAAPHRGTVLADGEKWFDWIDRYTNLLTHLPDNPFTLAMEGLLAAIRLAAHGGFKALPGLNSMLPGGEYLSGIVSPRVAHGARYHAIAANFTPSDENLWVRLAKRAGNLWVDKAFGEANDGIVPTQGSFETGAIAGGFPIPTGLTRVYERKAQVHHCNYFAHEPANRQIAEWLMGG